MNVKYGVLATLEARPGRADEAAELLQSARDLALAEPSTVTWYAFKMGDNTFGVSDTFADDEASRAHRADEIPIALGKVASELLSAGPAIDEVTIVAVK